MLEGSGRLPGFERMRQTYAKDTGEYSRVSYTNDDGGPAEGVWSDSLELLVRSSDFLSPGCPCVHTSSPRRRLIRRRAG